MHRAGQGRGTTGLDDESLALPVLGARYAAGDITPSALVSELEARITARGRDGIWISRTPRDRLLAAAASVEARHAQGEHLPLYGVPVAVKDNIDVAGLPTTAACPAFATTPTRSARVVERLEAAGAIVLGKTNLDQFATGLVGVRSPYGIPRNPFDPRYVVGGSSSGSAAAVARGEVSVALGTDTAGSGRVPAAFTNIVGLKPSRGVFSATGVVPACRSLDCVSVFAGTCDDAAAVAEVLRGFDPEDPYARSDADRIRFRPGLPPPRFRFGLVPAPVARRVGADEPTLEALDRVAQSLADAGGVAVAVDSAPFFEAGALLYGGPFVAERLAAAGGLLAEQPDALLPVIRTILQGATAHDARATFAALERLQRIRQQVAALWRGQIDLLVVPTAPSFPSIETVEADPIGANAALGAFVNFVNLLDLAALAVPAGFRDDGLPSGVSLIGPWGSDGLLADIGAPLHRAMADQIGATGWPLPASAGDAAALSPGELAIGVVGAHLSGEPLNHELTARGGRFLRATRTAARYRLFALAGTHPAKPGLVRVGAGEPGSAIGVEVWALPAAGFGDFVSRIPAPLAIGKLELEDGEAVSGFLCEAHATQGARDISAYGGWRAFRASTT